MKEDMWVFYVLLCRKGTYYAGVTKDMSRRYHQHVRGKASKYTRSHPPKHIAFTVGGLSKHIAMSMEANFKNLRRVKKEEFMRAEGKLWNYFQEGHAPLYVTIRDAHE